MSLQANTRGPPGRDAEEGDEDDIERGGDDVVVVVVSGSRASPAGVEAATARRPPRVERARGEGASSPRRDERAREICGRRAGAAAP
jgi:hypothetical protein